MVPSGVGVRGRGQKTRSVGAFEPELEAVVGLETEEKSVGSLGDERGNRIGGVPLGPQFKTERSAGQGGIAGLGHPGPGEVHRAAGSN